ncbi:MAG: hypothetical protein LBS27_06140 [Bifidobacteriaceae bacterium]|jgi:hypothetical protein|nr:hypothetical protein [Bifidobacteriaceae bacterium]
MSQTNSALKLVAACSEVATGNAVGGVIGFLGVVFGQTPARERLAQEVTRLVGAGWDVAAATVPSAPLTLPDKALTCGYIADRLDSASVASARGLVEAVDPRPWPIDERLVAGANHVWRHIEHQLADEPLFGLSPTAGANEAEFTAVWHAIEQQQERLSEAVDPVALLGQVASGLKNNRMINLCYAVGLVGLAEEQDLVARAESVEALGVVANRFPNDPRINLGYAKGLASLAEEQDLVGCARSVEALGVVAGRFPNDREINLEYVDGLFCLGLEQDLVGCAGSVEALGVVAGRFPDDLEINRVYAQGLLYLAEQQDLADPSESGEARRGLADRFAGDQNISLALMAALLWNLSVGGASAETVRELERVVSRLGFGESTAAGLADRFGEEGLPALSAARKTCRRALGRRNPLVGLLTEVSRRLGGS